MIMVERGSGRIEQLTQEEKNKLGNTEKKWVRVAMERLLDLLEDRKRLILDSKTMESTQKLVYEEWQPIAKKLQSEGFMYTTAACQKKYNNIRRSYFNSKKMVETQKSKFIQLGDDPSTKLIRVRWPYFIRFAAFIDEPVDTNIVIKEKDPGKGGNDEDEDEGDDAEDAETRSSKKSGRNSNSKYKDQVSSVVQTILKSEPVVILEDCVANEMDYRLQLVSDSVSGDVTIKEEVLDDEPEDEEAHQNESESLLRKLRRRTRETDETYCPSPSKRKRKPRVRYSPSRSSPSPSPPPEDWRETLHPQPKRARTFSLSSTTSDEVVTEIKRLRGDVSKMNRNLEDLVGSQNQLNQNFDKFFKLMLKRFK